MSTARDLIPLIQIPAELPVGLRGRPISIETVRNWHRRGINGHRLEIARIGGRQYVRRQALDRFLEAVAGEGGDEGVPVGSGPAPVGSPGQVVAMA